MGTPCSGPSRSPAITAASAALAAASAASADTVMNARSLPSRAATRSRWACTTSTGDTSRPAMARASSPMDRQTSSLTGRSSQDAEVAGGLGLAGQRAVERGEHGAADLHQREQAGELRVAEVQAACTRERAQRVEGERLRVHGEENSGWPSD